MWTNNWFDCQVMSKTNFFSSVPAEESINFKASSAGRRHLECYLQDGPTTHELSTTTRSLDRRSPSTKRPAKLKPLKMDVLRKRKCQPEFSSTESDGEDKVSPLDYEESRKQNHSEIEKRRRDKMNTYIAELATMVPMCGAMNRKLDKLTVLRMAVQHMKTLQGTGDTRTGMTHKPPFLSDDELKHLLLQTAEGFLFIVSCDRGRIMYTSESVKSVLSFTQSELLGQSVFDLLHPKDIPKLKEQLQALDLSPRERFIDAKTFQPVKTEIPQMGQRQSGLCSGARRAFFCRMKTAKKYVQDRTPPIKTEDNSDTKTSLKTKKSGPKSFIVVHCTGYIKTWPTAKIGLREDEVDGDDSSSNVSCLVAVGVPQPDFQPQHVDENKRIQEPTMEFTFRLTVEGKFTYVDQRATLILGYLPQELIGTSLYEYIYQDDIWHLSDLHRRVLQTKEKLETNAYRFRAKDSSFIRLKTRAYAFRNPWTKEMETVVCTNTVLPTQEVSSSCQGSDGDITTMGVDDEVSSTSKKCVLTVPGLPGGTRPGAGRIGRQIVYDLLETERECPEKSLPNRPPWQTNQLSRDTKSAFSSPGNKMLQNDNMEMVQGTQTPIVESGRPTVATSSCEQGCSDEMPIAMIMRVLEGDSGLTGPVDFSDIAWPL